MSCNNTFFGECNKIFVLRLIIKLRSKYGADLEENGQQETCSMGIRLNFSMKYLI